MRSTNVTGGSEEVGETVSGEAGYLPLASKSVVTRTLVPSRVEPLVGMKSSISLREHRDTILGEIFGLTKYHN